MAKPKDNVNGQRMGRVRGGSTARQQGGRERTPEREHGNPQQQHNPRRALGDIGNLAGPITTGDDAPKNESLQETRSGPMQNPAPTDRPVTRRYDETLAGNQHFIQVDEEYDENGNRRKKQRKSRSRHPSHEVHESTQPMDFFPEPMQVCGNTMQVCGNTNEIMTRSRTALLREENQSLAKQSQAAMLNEENQSFARQNETLVRDIDKFDAKNHIYVTDYVQNIYIFYGQAEIVNSVQEDYLSRQSEVNLRMRSILIDWLVEVHETFDLRQATLFLAVNIVDRFLSNQDVLRRDFQLVGLTAMLLACKYEEVCLPPVEDFVIVCDGIYTSDQILKMERAILRALQFNLSVPTSFVFMTRFLKAAGSNYNLEAAAFFLMELALVEYDMLTYSPSMLAAAAVYTASCTLRRHPSWNLILEYHTKYTEASLRECAKCMVDLHEKANYDSQINYVYKKYMSPRLYNVANLPPALFIRNT